MVAEYSFQKNKIKMQHKEEIFKHLSEVRDLALASTSEYSKQFNQTVDVTPIAYLLFLETYSQLFCRKDAELHLFIKKFKKGLQKIEQTSEDVKEMLQDIDESEKYLQKAQADSAELLKQITSQQSIAQRKQRKFEEAAQVSDEMLAIVESERNAIR